MTIEFVDVPINSMVDLSSSLCNRLPGRVKPPEIVDLPIENGDFPYKSPFSHGFPR
jgi:hypothetical protein